MDYKKLYLEQKIRTLEVEMSALQARYAVLNLELPQARKEWAEYLKELEKAEEEKNRNIKSEDIKKKK